MNSEHLGETLRTWEKEGHRFKVTFHYIAREQSRLHETTSKSNRTQQLWGNLFRSVTMHRVLSTLYVMLISPKWVCSSISNVLEIYLSPVCAEGGVRFRKPFSDVPQRSSCCSYNCPYLHIAKDSHIFLRLSSPKGEWKDAGWFEGYFSDLFYRKCIPYTWEALGWEELWQLKCTWKLLTASSSTTTQPCMSATAHSPDVNHCTHPYMAGWNRQLVSHCTQTCLSTTVHSPACQPLHTHPYVAGWSRLLVSHCTQGVNPGLMPASVASWIP